ncbi:ROK family protein, partial [Streptomonospora algeriensis]
AEEGDPGSRRVVAEAGAALGRGLGVLANTFNPELVVLGGELVEAGEALLERVRRTLELGTLGSALAQMGIVRGSLGDDASLRGALLLAAAAAAEV